MHIHAISAVIYGLWGLQIDVVGGFYRKKACAKYGIANSTLLGILKLIKTKRFHS